MRIYPETVKKWAIATGATSTSIIFLIFLYLSSIQAITINSYSYSGPAAGTEKNPHWAEINFTANENIDIYPLGYDPWGRNTPFNFSPALKGWKLYRRWGKGFREIDLTKPWSSTVKYAVHFSKGKNYSVRVLGFTNNPSDNIKWSFGPLDPVWQGITKESIFPKLISNKADIGHGEAVFQFYNPTGYNMSMKDLDFSFLVAKGSPLKSYDYFLQENVSYQVPIYKTEIVNKTCYRVDNITLKNESYDCSYSQRKVSGYQKKTKQEWIKSDVIPPGLQTIKLVGYWNPSLGEHAIDWVPTTVIKKEYLGTDKDLVLTKKEFSWWNSSWNDRKNATITENSGSTLTDYQVPLNITYDSDMVSDFSDLRFTWYNSTDGTEIEIPYWIEDKVNSSWVYTWVKVPLIYGGGTNNTVFVYYGNTTTVSSTSNPYSTFIAYDDFNRATIGSNWTIVSGSWTIDSNILKATDSGVVSIIYWNVSTISVPFVMEASLYIDAYYQMLDLYYDPSNGWLFQGGPDANSNDFIIATYNGTWDTATSGSATYDTWYRVKFRINDTYLRLVSNTSIDFVKAPSFSLDNQYVGFRVYNSLAWADNMWVRAYANPEPTYTLGSEETYQPIISKQWIEVPWFNNTHINYTLNIWNYNNLTSNITSDINVDVDSNFTDYTITGGLNVGKSNLHTETKQFTRPQTDKWFNVSGADISSGTTFYGTSNDIKMLLPIDPAYKYSIDMKMSSGIYKMEFRPNSLDSQDVIPTNQTSSKGILNITNNGTGTVSTIQIGLNETQAGYTLECANNSAFSPYLTMDTINQTIYSNLPAGNSFMVWCRMDYNFPTAPWTAKIRVKIP